MFLNGNYTVTCTHVQKHTHTNNENNKVENEKDATKAVFLLSITYMYVSLQIFVICWTDLQLCFLEKGQKLIERRFRNNPFSIKPYVFNDPEEDSYLKQGVKRRKSCTDCIFSHHNGFFTLSNRN